jgi:hypothetical protein
VRRDEGARASGENSREESRGTAGAGTGEPAAIRYSAAAQGTKAEPVWFAKAAGKAYGILDALDFDVRPR